MNRKTRTIARHEMTLNKNEIASMLGYFEGQDLPLGARLYVKIPGGGDYSNMDLDIDDEFLVYVEWEEISESS